jgi:hypothetical protein
MEFEEKSLAMLLDLDTFVKRAIFKTSPLEIIFKGHLFIEKEITHLIKLHLKEPLAIIKKGSPTFASKLELAVALGALTRDEKNSLKKLNEIRNNLAHESEYNLSEKDFDDLWSTFTSKHKELFMNFYNTLTNHRYNVVTHVAKFQLALLVLWTILRMAVDMDFPHKKRLERMVIRMEILRDEAEIKHRILLEEGEFKREQNRSLQEELRNIQEETRIVLEEVDIKQEQIRILKLERERLWKVVNEQKGKR